MVRQWSMRPYRDGDEEGIFELRKAVHPNQEYDREKWLKWWDWQYRENPAGVGEICLAEDADKIVGQYAVIPVRVKIGNESVLCAQSLDTMTHPDYRRQGIFESLAKELYGNIKKKAGIDVIYGFPNEFSQPGFVNKLEWFNIASMKVMCKPLDWRNAVRLKKVENRFLQEVLLIGAGLASSASLPFDKVFSRNLQTPVTIEGLDIHEIASFDKRLDEFWEKISSQHAIVVERSRDYLNWRYGAPEANYSILLAERTGVVCGYLVSRYSMHNGVKVKQIFDMVADSEEVMRCLISGVVEDSQQSKVDAILYLLIANKTYHQVLRRKGFLSVPFLRVPPLCAYSSSPLISMELLRNPRNWLAQTGDSDAVGL